MKSQTTKELLVISLLVIPATSLIVSLVLGSVEFSLAAMFATLLSSAVGVLLGVWFFSKVLRQMVGLKLYWLYGYVLILLAMLVLLLLPMALNETLAAYVMDSWLFAGLSILVSAMMLLSETVPKKATKKTHQ